MHRNGTHSSKITCTSCPPRQGGMTGEQAFAYLTGPGGMGKVLADETMGHARWTDQPYPVTERPGLTVACQVAYGSDDQPAHIYTITDDRPATAEQSRRDQEARDRAAQDRFYAGPMAAQYRG